MIWQDRVVQLKEERDDLLAACEAMLAANGDPVITPTGFECDCDICVARRQAKAAIAKAKGDD